MRYAAHSEEADDLVQESFIRAFQNLQKFDGQGVLGAWLRKISINVCLEMYRKNKTRMAHLTNYKEEHEDEHQLNIALQSMSMEDLLLKIQELPNGLRTIFNLYAMEGYNHRKIAEMLEISEGTSKSQYSRARMLLRERIENELQDENKILNHVRK